MGIFELKSSEFYKCKDLINENGQMEAKAIVACINPGRIFVDNMVSPKTGLIWLGNNDGFIFFGDEKNDAFIKDMNIFIDTYIVREAKKVDLNWFEGMGNHQKWDYILENMFDHRKLGVWNQRVYTLERLNKMDEPIIEEEYRVVKITNEFYENSNSLQKNLMHSKILESWTSMEEFIEKGIGYCILHNEQIVSICFSGFVVENVHCIHIETQEEHRRKKIGQKIAYQFVKDCLENEWIPYWECMDSNKPSKAIAENLGFKNIYNYVGYEFPLKI